MKRQYIEKQCPQRQENPYETQIKGFKQVYYAIEGQAGIQFWKSKTKSNSAKKRYVQKGKRKAETKTNPKIFYKFTN